MKAVGIVAEYNPFHSGHRYQIRKIREIFGAETPVAAVMSGDFVQRGEAASYDKFTRAEAAVRCRAPQQSSVFKLIADPFLQLLQF